MAAPLHQTLLAGHPLHMLAAEAAVEQTLVGQAAGAELVRVETQDHLAVVLGLPIQALAAAAVGKTLAAVALSVVTAVPVLSSSAICINKVKHGKFC